MLNKGTSFTILFILIQLNSFSQIFSPAWDAGYGCNYTTFFSLIAVDSSGYLLAGSTYSDACGNISQSNYDSSLTTMDFWIVRINQGGGIVWEKRYGGYGNDFLTNVVRTPDNGFLLGGNTSSFAGNDISKPPHGGNDYLIIKIDSNGNKLWDWRYGGYSNESLAAIVPSNDGSFYLVGSSISPSSFEKSAGNFDTTFQTEDYWIIKVDSSGNKIWDRTLGGTFEDIATCAITIEEDLVVVGYSRSSNDGNKTAANLDSTLVSSDFWVVKIDPSGNILWDKTFGGIDFEQATSVLNVGNGNLLIGGSSGSPIGFDILDSPRGNWDYWLIKLDQNGNRLWSKRYGGSGYDALWKLSQRGDTIILTGDSQSPASFEKSENNLGTQQGWVVAIDTLGNKIWDKTIFTPNSGSFGAALSISNTCFVYANQTSGNSGGYKSQNNFGSGTNYWMLELCDISLGTIENSENKKNGDFIIFPNPFDNEINIHSVNKAEISKAKLFTIDNRIVPFSVSSNGSNLKALTHQLTKGLYILQIEIGENIFRKLIIKN